MGANDLDQAFCEFLVQLQFAISSTGDTPDAAFFRIYSELAAENGDTIDLIYSPARKDGPGGYRVDGSAFDAERGVLYLALCDFREGTPLETLNAGPIEALTQKVRRFIELASDKTFLEKIQGKLAGVRSRLLLGLSAGRRAANTGDNLIERSLVHPSSPRASTGNWRPPGSI